MSSENKEIWKKIEDYDYIVSNFGRIKNLKNNNFLKPQDNRNGYLKVCLSKHGKVKQFLMHRLVAELFIDNPNNLPQVNHKDENKKNNNFSNLEWCTKKYNMN